MGMNTLRGFWGKYSTCKKPLTSHHVVLLHGLIFIVVLHLCVVIYPLYFVFDRDPFVRLNTWLVLFCLLDP